jgi:hypothetical protein
MGKSEWFSSPWVSRRFMGTRLKSCPDTKQSFSAACLARPLRQQNKGRPLRLSLDAISLEVFFVPGLEEAAFGPGKELTHEKSL